MKRIGNIILLAAMGMLFMRTSCQDKIIPSKHQTYKGRIMATCGKPAANFTFYFAYLRRGWGPDNTWTENCTTDANGYFTFINQHRYSPNTMGDAAANFLNNLPTDNENDLGNVYLGGSISFIRKLQVEKPYTNQDTLFLVNYNVYPPSFAKDKQIAIPGPFQDGEIIDTVWNTPYNNFPIEYGADIPFFTSYLINEYNGVVPTADFTIPSFCDSNLAVANIVIK